MINLLHNTPKQPSKFRTNNWVEVNDESRGTYNTTSQIKFKALILKSILCDYSDAYILAKGTIAVPNMATKDAATNNASKKVIIAICAPFTNCISKINNTQVDNAKDFGVIMSMYNLVEYGNNYTKTSSSL